MDKRRTIEALAAKFREELARKTPKILSRRDKDEMLDVYNWFKITPKELGMITSESPGNMSVARMYQRECYDDNCVECA